MLSAKLKTLQLLPGGADVLNTPVLGLDAKVIADELKKLVARNSLFHVVRPTVIPSHGQSAGNGVPSGAIARRVCYATPTKEDQTSRSSLHGWR